MRGAVVGAWVACAVACTGAGESLEPAEPTTSPAKPERDRDAPPTAAPDGAPIKLQTADGVLLSGTMWPGPQRTSGSDEPNGVVVFLHQLGSDRSEWAPYISELMDRYTVVAVDLRGHGDSTKSVDGRVLDWSSFESRDWALIVNDVRAVIEYVGVVEPSGTPVALVGSSIGSSAALLYAASHPDVYAVAMLSPGLSYQDLDAQAAVVRYGPRPILILAAEGDHASAMATRRLADLAQNRTVKVYKGDGHGVTMEGSVLDDVVSFVRKMPMRLEQPSDAAAHSAEAD